MKRDMDLVRAMLIFMSENDLSSNAEWGAVLPGYTQDQILHHAHLMTQGGLIESVDMTYMDSQLPMALPTSITWAGHDFLDAVTDDSLWAKAKDTVIKPAGGVAFTVLLEWAKSEAMRRLGMS
jgi:hypothetical protein